MEPRHNMGPAKPIMICPGDFSGAGREYRYPLGDGLNCQIKLSDGATVCNDAAYWYCDQTMTCCGMHVLFKGCGKRMCDTHCAKQYGDQTNMRLTNWHCTDEDCAERFFQAQKKCCMIAFAIFVTLFVLVALWSMGDDEYTMDQGKFDANKTDSM